MGAQMSNYISHTTVAKLNGILVKDHVILVLTVEVGGDQVSKNSPNIGIDVS